MNSATAVPEDRELLAGVGSDLPTEVAAAVSYGQNRASGANSPGFVPQLRAGAAAGYPRGECPLPERKQLTRDELMRIKRMAAVQKFCQNAITPRRVAELRATILATQSAYE